MTRPRLLAGQSGLPVANPTNSYWLKEPSEKLLGHRTTTELPHKVDVVIVGSGITGAFAAHSLMEQKSGWDVVILEAREACSGASGRNGGHCQPLMYTSTPHIASFEMRTYSYLKSLVENCNIPCDWHSTRGVHAYFSKSLFNLTQDVVHRLCDKYPDLAASMAVVTKAKDHSSDRLLETEQEELTLEKLRIPNAEGAIVQWNAARLWPYKLVAFILERLLSLSVKGSLQGTFNLQTKTPITGLHRVDPPTNMSSSNGSPAAAAHPTWIVHTPRGQIATRSVLLATNGYTSHLLPQFTDLIVPTRGQVVALKPPRGPKHSEAPLDIRHTYFFVGDDSDKAMGRDEYLVQRPPPAAELILGGGRERLARDGGIGLWDDSELEESVSRWLRGELPEVMDLNARRPSHTCTDKMTTSDKEKPAEKQDLESTHEWTGIMGYSRDTHPWVGSVPASLGGGEGLWICAGYTGNGMPNAALCAKAVAELMTGADMVDLPPEYKVTEDRVKNARTKDPVAVADQKGVLALEYLA
ncbi:FAD dependent oxidoreductase [Periconia macrospinosa]|uniref:FAD dependent oxidoreductase n=1 Tax=Periconia macrospinosa TaxID=97972 RepID=A0A2V1D4D5_9PLEO|nr:FAD dependent oxidoreductase [Periconia macrospinosa]